MPPFERFNPSYPHFSLGWVVCTIDKADRSVYYPKKDKEPCGYWEIEFEGKFYRRPDTYAMCSPYDWTKIEYFTTEPFTGQESS